MPPKQFWRNDKYRKKVLSTTQQFREILFFDTETTGLSSEKARIIEIAAIKFLLDETNCLQEINSLHLYIRPPFLLPSEIVELTGITDEQLQQWPYEEDQIDQIHDFFGDGGIVVAGHNVSFDVRFLNALYARNGYPALENCIELDTCEMAKDVIPKSDTENYKLGTLARVCGIDECVSFHSAIDDIRVTAKLFQILYYNYMAMEEEPAPKLSKSTPEVKSINFWEGYRGFSRIYVETSAGSLYFDVRNKFWAPKNVDMETIDVDHIERICWNAIGCTNADEFAKYRGKMTL